MRLLSNICTVMTPLFFLIGYSTTIFADVNENKCHLLFVQNLREPEAAIELPFESRSILKVKIQAYRKARIAKPDLKSIRLGAASYQILGILGKGTSVVYLARSSNGNLVQIKKIVSDTLWANSLFYEMTVTRFYLENGILVPKILDFEFKDQYEDGQYVGAVAFLVKEYFEGITGDELAAIQNFSAQERAFLQNKFQASITKLMSTHKGFAGWLKENQINLHENSFPELDRLIQQGDIKAANLMYASLLDDVVTFDP